MAFETKECQGDQASYLFSLFQETSQEAVDLLRHLPREATRNIQLPPPPRIPQSSPNSQSPNQEKQEIKVSSDDGYDVLEMGNEPQFDGYDAELAIPKLERCAATGTLYPERYSGIQELGPHHLLFNNDFVLLSHWIKYFFDERTHNKAMRRRSDGRMVIMSATASGIVMYPDGWASVSFNNYFAGQSLLFCDEVAVMHNMARRRNIPDTNFLSGKYVTMDSTCGVEMMMHIKPVRKKESEILYNQKIYFWPTMERNKEGKLILWRVSLTLPFELNAFLTTQN